MSNRKKDYDNSFRSWIDKISLYKMSYFPEPYTRSKNKIKVEIDLFNYAVKSDSKNVAGVDSSKFAKKVDLVSLKLDAKRLDIGKLKSVPVELSKFSNVVKNMLLKRLYIMNCLKKLMLFRIIIPVIKLKKLTATQKLTKLIRK